MRTQTLIEFNQMFMRDVQLAQSRTYTLLMMLLCRRDSCACSTSGPCSKHASVFHLLQTAEQALTDAAKALWEMR